GLATAIENAGALTEADYSPTSWEAVREALESAQAVYDDVDATQSEIDNTAQTLRDAMTGLTVDKTGLATAIENAGALTEADYSPTSWAAVREALESAQAVYDVVDAPQSEIDNTAQTLRDAMTGMPVDTT